jgi:hypothetical protein
MLKRNHRNCLWHCGRETRNHSRICDFCWANREAIYQERKAREAAVGLSEGKKAALTKARAARAAKFSVELTARERSDSKA